MMLTEHFPNLAADVTDSGTRTAWEGLATLVARAAAEEGGLSGSSGLGSMTKGTHSVQEVWRRALERPDPASSGNRAGCYRPPEDLTRLWSPAGFPNYRGLTAQATAVPLSASPATVAT